MNPYLPYAAIPAALIMAWMSTSYVVTADPGRYSIPRVAQIDDPSSLMASRETPTQRPDIRVKAFLPHKPPVPPIPEPSLILQGIMTGDDTSVATINGRVLKRGQQIEGYRIQRINNDGVLLVDGKRQRYLPMRPIHELPPVPEVGRKSGPGKANERQGDELTREFWKIFDSLKL